MNRDDIIRMAREVGIYVEPHGGGNWAVPLVSDLPERVERFAALVSAASKPETAIAEAYRCGYEAGAFAARDACIALCEEHWRHGGNAMECADAIRARGKE